MKLNLVASLVIIVVLIIYLVIYTCRDSIDNFGNGISAFKSCGDCKTEGEKGAAQCLGCTNCGWCVDQNGYGSCVQGDYTGPYYADCAQFMFGGSLNITGPGTGEGGTGKWSGNGNSIQGEEKNNSHGGPTVSSITATPFVVSLAGAMTNVSPSPFGNSTYNNNLPLRSSRRWRPPGTFRGYA